MLPAVPIYQKASDIQGYAKDATGKCYTNLTMNPNITYVRDATSFFPMKRAGENYCQMVDHIGINLSPDISTVLMGFRGFPEPFFHVQKAEDSGGRLDLPFEALQLHH